jgi:hypothetical protein
MITRPPSTPSDIMSGQPRPEKTKNKDQKKHYWRESFQPVKYIFLFFIFLPLAPLAFYVISKAQAEADQDDYYLIHDH